MVHDRSGMCATQMPMKYQRDIALTLYVVFRHVGALNDKHLVTQLMEVRNIKNCLAMLPSHMSSSYQKLL